jgi:hypothetical protein
MTQLSLSDFAYAGKRKQARRERFLADMGRSCRGADWFVTDQAPSVLDLDSARCRRQYPRGTTRNPRPAHQGSAPTVRVLAGDAGRDLLDLQIWR